MTCLQWLLDNLAVPDENPVIFNVMTSAAGLAVTECAGNSAQVYFWGLFFFLPPSFSTFAPSSLISLRMKLWGRSAWPLWVAYVVALVMFCDDPASAGAPLGPTGTSGLDNGVNNGFFSSFFSFLMISSKLAQTQTPLQLSGGVITKRSMWVRSAVIFSALLWFSFITDWKCGAVHGRLLLHELILTFS